MDGGLASGICVESAEISIELWKSLGFEATCVKRGTKSKRSAASSARTKRLRENETDLSIEKIKEIVANLPAEQRRQLIEFEGLTLQQHEGPLPSPADFQGYNEVLPDAANRIMTMAEKEQQMRIDEASKTLAIERNRIYGATAIGLGLVAVAGLAAWNDQIWIAVPLGLVGTFSAILRFLDRVLERRKRQG